MTAPANIANQQLEDVIGAVCAIVLASLVLFPSLFEVIARHIPWPKRRIHWSIRLLSAIVLAAIVYFWVTAFGGA